ncbi:MAG TPA: response regulator [bacterium]
MPVSKMPKAYCPSCGEDVEVFVMLHMGEEKSHCSLCGLVLEKEDLQEKKSLDMIVIAEDSAVLRNLVSELLITKKISKSVVGCADGKEFISTITDRLKKNMPFNIVILDVNMPQINGVNAAKTFRVLEESFGKKFKTPILFFSVVRCDENFKKFLDFIKPAAYLNKGNSSNPDDLAKRVLDVISRILQ